MLIHFYCFFLSGRITGCCYCKHVLHNSAKRLRRTRWLFYGQNDYDPLCSAANHIVYGVEDSGTYYEFNIASYKLSAVIMVMIIIKIITPHIQNDYLYMNKRRLLMVGRDEDDHGRSISDFSLSRRTIGRVTARLRLHILLAVFHNKTLKGNRSMQVVKEYIIL